jgi:membrane protease YdiL (CAAX protease family)
MEQSTTPGFSWRRDGPALLFAMGFPTLATYLYFVVFAGHPLMSAVGIVCKTIQFVLPLAWVWFVQGRQFALTTPNRQGLLTGLLIGLAVVTGMHTLYFGFLRNGPIFSGAPEQLDAKLRDLHVFTPLHFVLMAVGVSVIHALFEEYYWRWFVYGNLRQAIGRAPANLIAGLAFASHHVIVIGAYLPGGCFSAATLFFSFCVGVGGMVWAWLYERSGDLYGLWLSHMLVDFGIMLIGYDIWRMLPP